MRLANGIGDDGGQTVRDLLQLLENADSNGLAGFLETEHRELLQLRHRVTQYQEAISELKRHLHQVFSVAGGLGVLPLSETTRAVLGIERQSAAANDDHILVLQPPMTPITPGNSAASKTRLDLPHEPDAKPGQHLALSLPPAHSRSLSNRPDNAAMAVERSVQTDSDAFVAGLQQTIMEQRSDIEDLETSLRERKTLVRQLRKQLRDKELRQFAAASDHAGLRRTASIMVDSGCLLTHVRHAQVDNNAGTPELPASAADIPEDACSSEAVDDENTSGSDMPRRSSRRPSRFINGWPVYDDDESNENENENENSNNNNNSCEDSVNKANEKPSEPDADESNTQELQELTELPATAQLTYKQSLASELNNDGRSTSSLSKASTHRLFRSMVTKTPRRMFSSLSSKLKRS
ncbi:hypothetical protein LPJ56_003489 [Coemansia sp. RSA 2599]|nr:hypothetical protein LPJ56_003489 [Coemansia sp. RSA 2599]